MKEREMKYLPRNQHFSGTGGKIIRQVYLDLKNQEVIEALQRELPEADLKHISEARIRVSQRGDEVNCTLTAKSSGGEVRDEYEVQINQGQFNELIQCGTAGEINKERFECTLSNGLIAEIDVYSGKLEGLVTAEVEYDQDETSRLEVEMLLSSLLGEGEIISEYQCYKNKNISNSYAARIRKLIHCLSSPRTLI